MIKQGVGEHKQPTFKKLEVPGGGRYQNTPGTEIPRGWGEVVERNFHGGGGDIFWNYTNPRKDFWRSLFFSCLSSFMECHSTALLFQLFKRG